MKIAISYPPLKDIKGTPMISQNRQYQVFSNPTYIYPMVPAYAATLLKKNGYEVFWDDAIAEELTYGEWIGRICEEKPDVIAIETKTPVIKRHWRIIDEIKELVELENKQRCESCSQAEFCGDKEEKLKIENWKLKIVLMGDHITALPEESLANSKVDYALTGGDYDFMLLNLANHLAKSEPLEPGWHFRDEKGEIKNTGKFQLNHNLDDLPFIDRELAKWKLYAYENGNYKYRPGTYTMVSRDCWWRKNGGCAFCAWTTLYPQWRTQKPEKLLDEIGHLIEKYQVKEIFDDSGTFPVGKWLEDFCKGMIERGYNKKIKFSCNMRVGALSMEQYKLMGEASFRFILYGLESANQNTLDRLNKGIKIDDYEEEMRIAKKAGLEPHVTCMIGYPWEIYEDAKRTVDFTSKLFNRGYIDSLQGTIVIPYPGTALYKYCKENNLLLFDDYDRYDQRERVMKSELTDEQAKELVQGLYKSFITPKFILKKLVSIRKIDDIKFFWRAGFKVLGHLTDFKS